MAFSGDLKHLPIVDVVQLLNSSRRSGVLTVTGRRGESQLVFKDGYIVSASHLNGSVRIGQILVEQGAITGETLQQALRQQSADDAERRPLIVTLVEMGLVKEEDAYKGLEQLIEIALVEILTWKNGRFYLEPLETSVACKFRYYPERMNREINVDTQGVLMDALRVYDERMRDGLITEEDEEPIEITELLSADDLGLSDMDERATVLPERFEGLKPFDPAAYQRERLAAVAPHLCAEDRDELAAFLAPRTADPASSAAEAAATGRTVAFFSNDRLMQHIVATVCAHDGIPVAVCRSEDEAERAMAAATGSLPVLLMEAPGSCAGSITHQRIAALHQLLRLQYPDLTVIQLVAPDDHLFALHAYSSGVRAVIPRPLPDDHPDAPVRDLIRFLEALSAYLRGPGVSGQATDTGVTSQPSHNSGKVPS